MKTNLLKTTIICIVNILLIGTTVAPCFSAINISNDSINSNILNFSLFDLKVVSISFTKSSQLDILMNQHLDIIDIKDSEITAYVNLVQLKSLCDLGFNPIILFENLEEMNNHIYGSEFLQFHTYAQMTQELQEIANTYTEIAQLYDLGHSVQGRVIWGLKITDNPTVEENEAEVRICGCHHGNEYMSVELPLLMAWHLVQNYDTDPDIEDLVDNREIWIIPLVNPDGREMGTRYNANGVDLNRDYGYLWGGEGGSPGPFSQPETQIIRQHALENNFVLSLVVFFCSRVTSSLSVISFGSVFVSIVYLSGLLSSERNSITSSSPELCSEADSFSSVVIGCFFSIFLWSRPYSSKNSLCKMLDES